MRGYFLLSFPSVNTWNGRWTGADRHYWHARVLKKDSDLIGKTFLYDFGDGWTARVYVSGVRPNRKSDGFMGYEWMVDSIIGHGKIKTKDGK